MKTIYLTGAVIFLCIAHFIRVTRWQLFIEIYEKPQKHYLLQALATGYLLNYVLPYKLGDLFRAWISGRKMKSGKVLSLSTVIVDRYLDIVMVGVIFGAMALCGNDSATIKNSAVFYILAALILLSLSVIIYLGRSLLKRFVRVVADIFNPKIETKILRFAWSLIWNFKDIFLRINKVKLLLTTLGMWAFYLMSYFLYGAFLSALGGNISWIDVFTMLFTQNGIKASTLSIPLANNAQIAEHPYYMIIYMVLPLVVMLSLSMRIAPECNRETSEDHLNLLPHIDPAEQLEFLKVYFSGSNREYIANYLKINQNVSVIRDYSAGSNATTMLCMDEKQIFFRKYAFGEDGEKLYQQIQWLEKNRDKLPLPEILRQQRDNVYCYYDMPYNNNSVGLFEYIHSMPVEKSWHMIELVLQSLESSIYRTDVRPSAPQTIHEYIVSKIDKNMRKIKAAKSIKMLLQYEFIWINGIQYKNLPYFESFLSEEYLSEIFKDDTYAVIHGDLTIENIICLRDQDGKDGFYLIDPNTGNIHDSPNLDYGKLLQSIHGGYEFLMSTKKVTVFEDRIDFLFTRSFAYIELHKRLQEYMVQNLGYERARSIYFHEAIHWLRLMPYKIERDEKTAVLFYAGMIMVMNDIVDMYVK